MIEPTRISAEEAHRKVISGEAMLVCTYEDDAKFRKMHLQNAISGQDFKTRLPAISKEQEIIFY